MKSAVSEVLLNMHDLSNHNFCSYSSVIKQPKVLAIMTSAVAAALLNNPRFEQTNRL
jgi:hypothetical protein